MADLSSLLAPDTSLGNLPINLDSTPFGGLINTAKKFTQPLPGLAGDQGLVTSSDFDPQIPKSKKDLAWMALTALAPSVLATIPTAKNLPSFMKTVMENLGDAPKTPENLAKAFMETRYPKRMSLASSVYDPSLLSQNATGEAAGYYAPGQSTAQHTIIRYAANPAATDPVRDMVNTLGHETQHAVQQRRIPNWVHDLDQNLPYARQFLETGNAGATGNSLIPGSTAPQPTSTGAWGAGATAEKAYRTLMQLLSAAKQRK